MRSKRSHRAFTLIELLVTIGIIAILAGLSFPAYSAMINHANCAGCSSHMRALGIAFTTYAIDHDGQLPGRVQADGVDKWPTLLQPYVPGPATYVDPGDTVAVHVPLQDMISNAANNSSFFFNGFNDLGAYTNPDVTVGMAKVSASSSLALLGQKVRGSTQYYMDFVEGNENDILNKQSYYGGSNYTFADGSVQFIPLSKYDNTMWLMDKSYSVPTVPGH